VWCVCGRRVCAYVVCVWCLYVCVRVSGRVGVGMVQGGASTSEKYDMKVDMSSTAQYSIVKYRIGSPAVQPTSVYRTMPHYSE
jgi:hypothetical protein